MAIIHLPGAKRAGPDGGDYDDGMEARIQRLEDFAAKTGERMARIEITLEYVAREVTNFKWWVIGAIAAIVFSIIGTGIAVQQMTVTTFQAAAQVGAPPQQQPAPIIITVPAAQPPGESTKKH